MAGDTHVEDCIVLKKTKLGEADLIVTFMNARGERCQAIAKGARKPQGAFSSYLELGNTVHVLFARGRRLDVVTDVRLEEAHRAINADAMRFACASCILEAALKTTEESLEQPRLFDMTRAALFSCERLEAADFGLLVAAYLLKACAMAGLRPSMTTCAACGGAMALESSRYASFSYVDGGVLCERCARGAEHASVRNATLLLADALVVARFEGIPALEADRSCSKQVLDLAHRWASVHAGARVKSIEMLELYC